MGQGKAPSASHAWFIWDPCGLVCAALVYILIFYASFVVLFILLDPLESFVDFIHMTLFLFCVGSAVAAHWRAMTSNPGSVPLPPENFVMDLITKNAPERRNGELVTNCHKCRNYKPFRAHHCSVCQRCVRKMDHHCPWVNNCVGEFNLKFFMQFCMYISLSSLYALSLVVSRVYTCIDSDWKECGRIANPLSTVLICIVSFEGVIFALFTCIMFWDQVCNLETDSSKIDRLKKKRAANSPTGVSDGVLDGDEDDGQARRDKAMSLKDKLAEACGSRPGLHWVFPTRRRQRSYPEWHQQTYFFDV